MKDANRVSRDQVSRDQERARRGRSVAAMTPFRGAEPLPVNLLRQVQRFGGNQAVLSLLQRPDAQIHRCKADCNCQRGEAMAAEARPGVALLAVERGMGNASSQQVLVDSVAREPAVPHLGAPHEPKELQPDELGKDEGAQTGQGGKGTPALHIQRVATWSAGAVNETNNLADALVNGTNLGFTWPTLNGRKFWGATAARPSLGQPTLSVTAAARGNGYEAGVDDVPTNTGSFDETVLAPGPWTLTTTKAAVGARFPALAACSGSDETNFQAKGKPNDAHMFQANRRHEDHHVNDHKAAFNGSIGPWDKKLTAAKDKGKKFKGSSETAARDALWAAMGGEPNDIADKFSFDCLNKSADYHTSPQGALPTRENPRSSPDCTTSSVESHNPS